MSGEQSIVVEEISDEELDFDDDIADGMPGLEEEDVPVAPCDGDSIAAADGTTSLFAAGGAATFPKPHTTPLEPRPTTAQPPATPPRPQRTPSKPQATPPEAGAPCSTVGAEGQELGLSRHDDEAQQQRAIAVQQLHSATALDHASPTAAAAADPDGGEKVENKAGKQDEAAPAAARLDSSANGCRDLWSEASLVDVTTGAALTADNCSSLVTASEQEACAKSTPVVSEPRPMAVMALPVPTTASATGPSDAAAKAASIPKSSTEAVSSPTSSAKVASDAQLPPDVVTTVLSTHQNTSHPLKDMFLNPAPHPVVKRLVTSQPASPHVQQGVTKDTPAPHPVGMQHNASQASIPHTQHGAADNLPHRASQPMAQQQDTSQPPIPQAQWAATDNLPHTAPKPVAKQPDTSHSPAPQVQQGGTDNPSHPSITETAVQQETAAHQQPPIATSTPEVQAEATDLPSKLPVATSTPEVEGKAADVPMQPPVASSRPEVQAQAADMPSNLPLVMSRPEGQAQAAGVPSKPPVVVPKGMGGATGLDMVVHQLSSRQASPPEPAKQPSYALPTPKPGALAARAPKPQGIATWGSPVELASSSGPLANTCKAPRTQRITPKACPQPKPKQHIGAPPTRPIVVVDNKVAQQLVEEMQQRRHREQEEMRKAAMAAATTTNSSFPSTFPSTFHSLCHCRLAAAALQQSSAASSGETSEGGPDGHVPLPAHRWGLTCKKPDPAVKGSDKAVEYECSEGCHHVYHFDCYKGLLRDKITAEYMECKGKAAAKDKHKEPGVCPCVVDGCTGRIIGLGICAPDEVHASSLAPIDPRERQKSHWEVSKPEWLEQQRKQREAQEKEKEKDDSAIEAIPSCSTYDPSMWQNDESYTESQYDDGADGEDYQGGDENRMANSASSDTVPTPKPVVDLTKVMLRELKRASDDDLPGEAVKPKLKTKRSKPEKPDRSLNLDEVLGTRAETPTEEESDDEMEVFDSFGVAPYSTESGPPVTKAWRHRMAEIPRAAQYVDPGEFPTLGAPVPAGPKNATFYDATLSAIHRLKQDERGNTVLTSCYVLVEVLDVAGLQKKGREDGFDELYVEDWLQSMIMQRCGVVGINRMRLFPEQNAAAVECICHEDASKVRNNLEQLKEEGTNCNLKTAFLLLFPDDKLVEKLADHVPLEKLVEEDCNAREEAALADAMRNGVFTVQDTDYIRTTSPTSSKSRLPEQTRGSSRTLSPAAPEFRPSSSSATAASTQLLPTANCGGYHPMQSAVISGLTTAANDLASTHACGAPSLGHAGQISTTGPAHTTTLSDSHAMLTSAASHGSLSTAFATAPAASPEVLHPGNSPYSPTDNVWQQFTNTQLLHTNDDVLPSYLSMTQVGMDVKYLYHGDVNLCGTHTLLMLYNIDKHQIVGLWGGSGLDQHQGNPVFVFSSLGVFQPLHASQYDQFQNSDGSRISRYLPSRLPALLSKAETRFVLNLFLDQLAPSPLSIPPEPSPAAQQPSVRAPPAIPPAAAVGPRITADPARQVRGVAESSGGSAAWASGQNVPDRQTDSQQLAFNSQQWQQEEALRKFRQLKEDEELAKRIAAEFEAEEAREAEMRQKEREERERREAQERASAASQPMLPPRPPPAVRSAQTPPTYAAPNNAATAVNTLPQYRGTQAIVLAAASRPAALHPTPLHNPPRTPQYPLATSARPALPTYTPPVARMSNATPMTSAVTSTAPRALPTYAPPVYRPSTAASSRAAQTHALAAPANTVSLHQPTAQVAPPAYAPPPALRPHTTPSARTLHTQHQAPQPQTPLVQLQGQTAAPVQAMPTYPVPSVQPPRAAPAVAPAAVRPPLVLPQYPPPTSMPHMPSVSRVPRPPGQGPPAYRPSVPAAPVYPAPGPLVQQAGPPVQQPGPLAQHPATHDAPVGQNGHASANTTTQGAQVASASGSSTGVADNASLYAPYLAPTPFRTKPASLACPHCGSTDFDALKKRWITYDEKHEDPEVCGHRGPCTKCCPTEQDVWQNYPRCQYMQDGSPCNKVFVNKKLTHMFATN